MATYWLTAVYEHPLWEKITSGRATRAQVLGFAFEKYHYIEVPTSTWPSPLPTRRRR